MRKPPADAWYLRAFQKVFVVNPEWLRRTNQDDEVRRIFVPECRVRKNFNEYPRDCLVVTFGHAVQRNPLAHDATEKVRIILYSSILSA